MASESKLERVVPDYTTTRLLALVGVLANARSVTFHYLPVRSRHEIVLRADAIGVADLPTLNVPTDQEIEA